MKISTVLRTVGMVAISLLSSMLAGALGASRLKDSGAYGMVRLPLYASEMLFYFGFVMGNMSAFNLHAVTLILAGQIYRAHSEERLLSEERRYAEYRDIVRSQFLPGFY